MVFKSRRNLLIILAIAVVALGAFFLVIPGRASHLQGSTYSTEPWGYGAWWQWMADAGTPVERWRKPGGKLTTLSTPATLLKVNPQAIVDGAGYDNGGSIDQDEHQWITQGNRLVYLGRWAPLTAAPFGQTVDSDYGPVKIQGRRRFQNTADKILSDEYGTLIWREKQGKGEIIWVVPPFLAANAFRDNQANFALLQSLMMEGDHQLWVDEYLHGYKDAETLKEEAFGSVWGYLQRTPLFPLFVQLIILTVILIIGGNRRFGQPQEAIISTINNNQAYINALAQVLEKGDRPEFAVQQFLHGEMPTLIRKLGELDPSTDLKNSADQAVTLKQTLVTLADPDKLPKNENELRVWLKQWQQLQAQLPPSR